MNRKVSCVLCQRSEETEKTGSLLTEDQVTAHHKCMLYSAAIFCRDSPQFGDLCGFRAEDVKMEVNRGKKLVCSLCKKRGATVGCEVGRCKKSYHYPCAVEDGAKAVDDDMGGRYLIYCVKHYPGANNGSMVRHNSSVSQTPSCSASGAQPSKRHLSPTDVRLGGSPAKRSTEDWFPTLSDDSFYTEESNTDMEIYAPIESDIEDNEMSEQQNGRAAAEEPVLSPSGSRRDDKTLDENEDDATIVYSPDDSQSLLLPVEFCMDTPSHSSECSQRSPATSQTPLLHSEQEPAGGATGDFSVKQSSSPAQTSTPPPGPSHEPEPPLSFPMGPPSTAPLHAPPPPPPPSPEPSINPSSFWRNCNAAGCTQAIFQDFFNEMKDVATRIWSGQASDEDYHLALSVTAASGKLAAYVAKQQEELQRKQRDLQKASAAMTDAVTALKKRPSAASR